ncbi:hypothetical protein [Gimesia chilikensis]|uniref:hypothetical protein n=1 Tax=Gimesia chilikensis TaxID=2605989 RepID=UPI003A91C83C
MVYEVPLKDLRPQGYSSATCPSCVFYDKCGGLHNHRPLMNCFDQFCCENGTCDHVCPYKPADFQMRMREIGGLRFDDIRPLYQTSISLPSYIPMIHHASRRSKQLNTDTIALDPYKIFGQREGHYKSLADDGETLRRTFKLNPNSKIILRGTAMDPFLENYWSFRKIDDVAGQIAALGISLFIGPNYSQFLDVPRTDCIYNRKRQLLCLAELSEKGVSVAPHLSATMPPDWTFWENFLCSNENIQHVAINFQTGNKNRKEGLKVIDRIRKLQNTVGRQISLIPIGGTQFIDVIAQYFESFALIDSEPFFKSISRKLFKPCGNKRDWESTWTLKNQTIDHILQANIDSYTKWVLDRKASTR